MKNQDTVTRRQMAAVAFVAILSPLIRRFPRTLAITAGRSAWLSVPMAALVLAAGFLLAKLLLKGKPAGTGLAALFAAALGRPVGRALTGIYGLWLAMYAGFLLRSGAIRFISTVYLGAGPAMFIVFMALACAVAALGAFKTIARSAMLLRPLMLLAPLLVFLLTVKDADYGLLLPVTAADLLPNGWAALKIANLLAVGVYLGFAGQRVTGGSFGVRDYAVWTGALLAVIGAMTIGCLGMFGPELTGNMTFPFFMLARDVTVLGSFERVEPIVIALWVFSDFVLVSTLLWISCENLRFCLGLPGDEAPPKLTDMKRGRALIPLAAALAVAAALLAPEDVDRFYQLSETIVPLCNAALAVALPLLALLVGKLRKTI